MMGSAVHGVERRRVALAIGILAAAGCGSRNHPQCVPIHGLVTLGSGSWPKEGEVYFLPLEPAAGLPRRAAVAKFQIDGQFSTPTSWVEGDGVVPGRYRVYVVCWKTPPTRSGPPPIAYTDPKYVSGATSDIEVTINAESEDEDFHWDFPAAKR